MRPVMVIDVVGMTPRLLAAAPEMRRLAAGGFQATMAPAFPGVTLTAQANMLTGALPKEHGIVGNGWFFRDLGEVWLWRQSAHLVQSEFVWDAARRQRPGTTVAQTFWWFNLGNTCDVAVTPRPVYHVDGRKSADFHARPAALKEELRQALGEFPLFSFWGPGAGIKSSTWIAQAALAIWRSRRPGLHFVYLPHLDYALQRLGPEHPRIGAEVAAVDALVGELARAVDAAGGVTLVVSEYGIEAVDAGVAINRSLREAGWLAVVANAAGELLDPFQSRAFAVVDHQIAHVYVRNPADVPLVAAHLARLEGVDEVLDAEGQARLGLDHPRSGELVAVAAPRRWFTYAYWLDERMAPDFARTVEIHRKPGYDPLELFVDPRLPLGGKPAIAWRLLKRALGFRAVMDVIPLDDRLVRGSHGRLPATPDEGPLFISSVREEVTDHLAMTDLKRRLLGLLGA